MRFLKIVWNFRKTSKSFRFTNTISKGKKSCNWEPMN